MGLGLSSIRKDYVEPEDTAPEPETVPAPEGLDAAPADMSAADETAAAPEAEPVRDAFDAVGDMIPEKAAPSIDEIPAAPAGPEAAAPKAEAAEADSGEAKSEKKPEDELSEDEKAAVAAYAAANGMSQEDAAAYFIRERAAQAARAAGMAPREAQQAAADDTTRRAMQEAMRASGGGGGQGAISALVGGIAAAVKGTAGLAGSAVSKLARKPIDNSPGAVRERTFEHWYDGYEKSMAGLNKAGSDLKSRAGEFNAAFLATEAASRLRKMAADGGQELDAFMSDLSDGKGSEAAMEAAREAMSDPKVSKAWQSFAEADGRAHAARDGILSNFEKVARNFPDRVDMGVEADRISEANDAFMKDMKKPIFEGSKGKEASDSQEEQQKKFMERMKEIAETIRKMVERILSRFGMAPGR